MDPRRWQQVKEILSRALEHDEGDPRAAVLDDACGGDEELRRDVESLLAAGSGAASVVDEPVFRLRPPTWVGRRIGPYRVLREIGRGGLGTVYLAAREDREFEQRVALKVVKRGMDTDEVVRRFRVERQILAGLEHPNVARLLDGGTTDDGLPFFVMEHVEGEPLDRFCDARKLSVKDRLELFLEVCSAVHFAHQNLVIHRDLKPGNVLVTAEGPKLLDFGIAKLLAPDGGTVASVTGPGSAPMTPEYASPEQAGGESVTTASDVYSLGVVLYELLTGRLPYRLDGCDPLERLRRIRAEEPPRPSTVAGGRRLAGDLDAIVLKALRKEPSERYGSVERLADDVRRHLAGRPVSARRGTFAYRAGKLVRRHKLALAALLVVVVSAVTTTVWWRQAVAANERAVDERVRAENALEFLKSLFRAADPDRAKGRDLSAVDVLEGGRARAEGLDDPVLQADVLDTLGGVYRDLGLYPEARELFERSVDAYRALHPGDHPDVARAVNNLAGVLYRSGEYQRAGTLFREALTMRRRLGQEPVDLAKATCNLATILMNGGAYEAAEELYLECLSIRQEAYGGDDPDVAMSLRSLGTLYYTWGDLERAEPYLARAHEVQLEILEPRHTRLALTFSSLGRLRLAQGRYEEAGKLLWEALDIRSERYGEDHPHVALTKKDLAELRLARGDCQGARELLEVVLETLRETKSEDSWEIADGESLLCACRAARGEFREAEPCLLESYEVLRESRGARSVHARKALGRIVELYTAWGKPAKADEYRSSQTKAAGR